VVPCLRQHLVGHVNADDLPGPPDMMGGNEAIETRTRSDVDDALALCQRPQRGRIGDAGERFHGRVR
jgi:hypothetical protein